MKIGIIDIGTRATRLLVGDTEDLTQENTFSFSHYKNVGTITDSGKGIRQSEDGSFYYEMRSFEKTMQVIDSFMNVECPRHGVPPENITAVGTEVFRRVTNFNDLVSLIRRSYSFDFKVLHPLEEAYTSMYATVISCRQFYNLEEPMLIVEQGGGSTQITVAALHPTCHLPDVLYQVSIPELGMVLLRQRFFDYKGDSAGGDLRRVGTMQREVYDFAMARLEEYAPQFEGLSEKCRPKCAFALGTVITDVFPNAKNASVHGREVRIDVLNGGIPPNHYLNRYANYAIGSLLKDARGGGIGDLDEEAVRKDIETLYGRACYAAVLDRFGLNSLRVSGAALRYGVFFRIAYGAWQNIRTFNGNSH